MITPRLAASNPMVSLDICSVLHVTFISGMVILLSGFLSSIRKISVRSSSLIFGLHNTQDNETGLFAYMCYMDTKVIHGPIS